jgi:hypothetical protein
VSVRARDTVVNENEPGSVQKSARGEATVGLCFRETGFCGAETAASKRPVTFNRSSAETKPPHENPPIRRYLHDTRKSLFVWDCMVGLRGLELRANHVVAIEPISGP